MSPVRRLSVLAAVIGLLFLGFALGVPRSPEALRDLFGGLGVLGPLVFALVWVFLTPALASGTLLAATAGLSFGVAMAIGVGVVGATVGGALAFGIARRFGRSAGEALMGPRLRRLAERVERRGFLAVLSARIAPGVPTTMLNYVCGLSRVRLRDFIAGTAIGGAPRIAAYAALGASGGDFLSPPALAGIGLVAVMGLALPVVALLRRLRPVAV